ncbi:MAG: N-acetyltransferase [Deltaproteobacteria bacterium]|nr:N-acetyltransferase [Deltaproteobacteria bacterium]
MEFTIRKGKPSDNREVEYVTREAFWNLYVPGCDEHLTIHNIWTHKDFIPDLYYVAVTEDKIVGCIVFTASHLEDENSAQLEIVTFGPVCVLPDYQHLGIGGELIRKGIAAAKEMGYPAIIILGDPHNYCRHGFKNSRDYNISNSEGKYPLGQLLHLLDESKITGSVKWRFVYSDVYNVSHENLEEYDRQFPVKEKCVKPSQVLFNMLVRSYIE